MKNTSMEMKLLKYIWRTLSLFSTIFTILSFYGYSSSKNNLIYFVLGVIFFMCTIFIVINRKNI